VKKLTVSHNYFGLFSGYLDRVKHSHANIGLCGSSSAHTYTDARQSYPIEDIIRQTEQIRQITGDMSFGLTMGEDIHPSDYGLVGYALLNCPDLATALKLAARYKPVMNQAFEAFFIPEEHHTRYQINPLIENPGLAPMVELDFASGIQLARLLVGKRHSHKVKFIQVSFCHAPLCCPDKYRQLFNCPVKFYQDKNEILVANEVLALPVRSADEAIFNMLLKKITRLENSRRSQQSFSHKVVDYISRHKDCIPSATQAASDFNISLSTLKKHLMREGENYSAICDAFRKKVAINMVSDPLTQIKEVYRQLNFSSSSAFNRAFKRWTSVTPTQYRQNITNKNKEAVKKIN